DSPRVIREDLLTSAARDHAPTASATHFFMWLAFAAPASFFSVESFSHVVLASRSHFCIKLLSAAPASFLSAASDLQVAKAVADTRHRASTSVIAFMDYPPFDRTAPALEA